MMTKSAIRVRLHTNWCDDRTLREVVNGCTSKRDYRWKEIELVDGDSYDFLVVFNRPQMSNFDPSRTILFENEPFPTREVNRGGLSFAVDDLFAYVDVPRHFPLDAWDALRSRERLDGSPEKPRVLSAVVSGERLLPRHRTRLSFVQGPLSTLGELDHFGRGISGGSAYRGELPSKLEGLLPYRYTFNAENWIEPNYFTEKIIDAILCETLCFYDGCPNIDYFLDPESFLAIDMAEPESATARIREAIAGGEWEKRIEAIRAQKQALLTRLHPLEIVRRIILGEPVTWRPDRRPEPPVVLGHPVETVDVCSVASLDSALGSIAEGRRTGIIVDGRARYTRDASVSMHRVCEALLPGEIGLLGGVGVSPFGAGPTRSLGTHELCVPLLEQGWCAAALALGPAAARTLVKRSKEPGRGGRGGLVPRLLWPPVAFVPGPYLRDTESREMPDGLELAASVPAQGERLRRIALLLPRGRSPGVAAAGWILEGRSRLAARAALGPGRRER